MATKSQEKRGKLREKLIDAAEAQIADVGLTGLKARDVTAAAGCSLGALYNVVEDLDHLVILVNSRTLNRLGDAVKASVRPEASAAETMETLALTYTDFAQRNPNLWSAVFSHHLPEGKEIPDWHKKEHAVLVEQIIRPLSQLRPDMDETMLIHRAFTLFAAVHGVVQLSFHGGHIGHPADMLKSEISALVDTLVRGTPEEGQ